MMKAKTHYRGIVLSSVFIATIIFTNTSAIAVVPTGSGTHNVIAVGAPALMTAADAANANNRANELIGYINSGRDANGQWLTQTAKAVYLTELISSLGNLEGDTLTQAQNIVDAQLNYSLSSYDMASRKSMGLAFADILNSTTASAELKSYAVLK